MNELDCTPPNNLGNPFNLDCAPPDDFNPETDPDTWLICESLLGSLWDDVFQRIVIYNWIFLEEQAGTLTGVLPTIAQTVATGLDINDYISDAEAIERYTSDSCGQIQIESNGRPVPPVMATNDVSGRWYLIIMMEIMKADPDISAEFERKHLDPLIAYFSAGFAKSIPVYLLQGRGYDYLLSSDGIEFVMPPPPAGSDNEFMREVYRLYRVRITSRSPLILPPNNCPTGTHSCDPPGVTLSDQLHTVRMIETDNNIEQIQFGLPMLLRFLSNSSLQLFGYRLSDMISVIENATQLNQEEPFNCRAFLRQLASESRQGNADGSRIPSTPVDPDDNQEDSQVRRGREEPSLEYSVATFICSLVDRPLDSCTYQHFRSITRCWQLSGSVFRRIANELPRIKAQVWLSRLNSDIVRDNVNTLLIPEAEKPNVDNVVRSNFNRLDNRYSSNNDDDGARSIFQERLESTMPGENEMYFRGLRPNEAPFFDEIVIHKYGITLPRICEGPDKQYIYQSWKNGQSANPVFTDSTWCC